MSQGMTHKYSDIFLKTTTCNKSLLFFPDFDKASGARTMMSQPRCDFSLAGSVEHLAILRSCRRP